MKFSITKSTMAILILAAVTSTCEAGRNPYCNIKSCTLNDGVELEDQLFCKYKPNQWNSRCDYVMEYDSMVNSSDVAIILSVHNKLRRQIAKGLDLEGQSSGLPKASNMNELVWDKELALLAQTWAVQCKFEHDKCSDVARFPVGQNIFIESSGSSWWPVKKPDWVKAINDWYSEVKDVSTSNIKRMPKESSDIGHYTQVAWAQTTHVGCGVSSYQLSRDSEWKMLYVCNYGKAGNYPGEAVYKQGNPGSACPKGTYNNNGLCSQA